ncbi:MAG TPA: AraC family transcriptional regulator [Burkholderiaceae bacterium]|nr:AraC family transcriptional regulator [Burkholderiaceae bacterium]
MRAASPARRGPPTERAATPIAFVKAVLLGYQKYGADPGNALREARIAPSLLRQPSARVTASQFEALCRVAMPQLDDEALGWFSRKLPWGSYGMLCRASLTAPNLGVALKRWCRHHRLLTDDIVLDLTVAGGVARLSINENRRLREMREFCLLTSLRYVHGYACWAVDSLIALHEVAFPFPPPPHHGVYPLLFPGPVHFNAAKAGFAFDAQYLALLLRRDERALQTMLQRALPLTVRQYRRDRLLVQHLRELLRTRGTELSNAEAVAGALNVSPRTLHRQLQEEGASLQALKDEVRRGRAIEQLLRTTRSVKQIARDVGFRNEKSFTRAFKQWTGHSPIEYRSKADVGSRSSK